MDDYNPLRPGYGALFVFPYPHYVSIWMKNTPCALDIIFITEDMHVTNIHKHAIPYDETKITSTTHVKYVVETLSGYCDIFGITPGQRVTFHNADLPKL